MTKDQPVVASRAQSDSIVADVIPRNVVTQVFMRGFYITWARAKAC